MSDTNLDIDPALLAEFIDESLDMLSGVGNMFVQLETEPENKDVIDSIFRPVHSIKGNSAFFGFTHVKALAHEMETLLDQVRKGAAQITPPMISVLLKGCDALREMLERGREGQSEVADETAFDAVVNEVKAVGQEGGSPDASWEQIFATLNRLKAEYGGKDPQIGAYIDQILQHLEPLAPGAQQPPNADTEIAEGQPPALARIAAILEQPLEEQLPDNLNVEVGEALKELKDLAAGDETRALIDESIDAYDTFTASVGFDALLQDLLMGNIRILAERGQWPEVAGLPPEKPAADAPAPDSAQAAPEKTTDKAAHKAAKTMRINENYIDTFMSYVGELLVVGDLFNYLERRLAESEVGRSHVTDFRRANETFASLSNELQRSIMAIRKVSVKGLLQKVPRMVRDIAVNKNKDIDVELYGEDVEVDKSLVDMLDAPLTHMARNAADHGIEAPDTREAAGKPRAGHVRVGVYETETNIVLAVTDDGAGLNYEAIRTKAESLGLVNPGEKLTDDDVVNFLFSSGVSTATEVTDVSGRGVGMDVVRRMIDEAGGSIEVESKAGEGSEFRVLLPKSVTTQIIQGFLVECAGQNYVFPMSRVHETSKVERGDITTVTGKGRCVKLHGRLLPVVSLRKVFGLPPANGQADSEVLVTMAARKEHFALSVDDVVGVQQVVSREIEGLTSASEAISGGALMGDGSVSLIIDVDKLYTEYNGVKTI